MLRRATRKSPWDWLLPTIQMNQIPINTTSCTMWLQSQMEDLKWCSSSSTLTLKQEINVCILPVEYSSSLSSGTRLERASQHASKLPINVRTVLLRDTISGCLDMILLTAVWHCRMVLFVSWRWSGEGDSWWAHPEILDCTFSRIVWSQRGILPWGFSVQNEN